MIFAAHRGCVLDCRDFSLLATSVCHALFYCDDRIIYCVLFTYRAFRLQLLRFAYNLCIWLFNFAFRLQISRFFFQMRLLGLHLS